jgi:hypothetical protein
LPSGQDGDVIVVIGERLPGSVDTDAMPLEVLDVDRIRAFGASNLADLLEQIESKTKSDAGRLNQGPVLLVNGRRLSGAADFAALPPEAILRIEIYPEKVALEQGFSAGQRVVNVVLQKTFSATTAEIRAVGSTANAFGDQFADASLFQINGDSRVNISARFAHNSGILAGERGIFVRREIPLSVRGVITGFSGQEIDPTLSALAGKIITMVEVPVNGRSLADFAAATTQIDSALHDRRTIIPTSENFGINASIARPIGRETNFSVSFGSSFSTTRDMLGLSPVKLLIAPMTTALPFSGPVSLTKVFDPALSAKGSGKTANVGLALTGKLGAWTWSTDVKWIKSANSYQAKRGIDALELQRLVNQGTDPLVTNTDIPTLSNDSSRYFSGLLSYETIVGGALFDLPAGQLGTKFQVGGDWEDSSGYSRVDGDSSAVSLSRRRLGVAATIELPITSWERDVLSKLGDLSMTVRVANRWISDVGRLPNWTISFNWSPLPQLNIASTWIDQKEAPTLLQLGAPTQVAPQRVVYDFVRKDTVLASVISGGNSNLQSEQRRDFRLQVNWKPITNAELNLFVVYVNIRASNSSVSAPLFTEAVENSLPGLVVRDVNGRIISIDQRNFNSAIERSEQLSWSVNYSSPRGSQPSSGSWSFVFNHRLRLRDERTLRNGLPVLDYLNGAAFSFRGGIPRHEIESELALSQGGKGIRLSGIWRAGSKIIDENYVATTARSGLNFSPTLNLNFRAYIDLGQLSKNLKLMTWFKSTRLTLKVNNFLNNVMKVRDADQRTPLSYQRGYLDPYGRTLEISLRKQF